jgi:hypothetical protein
MCPTAAVEENRPQVNDILVNHAGSLGTVALAESNHFSLLTQKNGPKFQRAPHRAESS